MDYKSYQHLERLGTSEVENIELGQCHVFPKIDGSNASVWLNNGIVMAGSRRRQLSLEADNQGFYEWVLQQENIKLFLLENPTLRIFGEWLIPHSLKTYRDEAWKDFYAFDVCRDTENGLEYLHYEEYRHLLSKHGIKYIPAICTITNGSYEQFIKQLVNNVFLIKDGHGAGEGIVIKRYDYKNKYGRTVWAKIVTSEFKEKHAMEMGGHVLNGKKLVEEQIALTYCTHALCDKELQKIITDTGGWSSKLIPRLLHTVYYSIVKEDCWEFVKEHNNPTIDFKRLQYFIFANVKTQLKELF